MVAAKRVLRYLRNTSTAQLVLSRKLPVSESDSSMSNSANLSIPLQGWFDASWTDDPDDQRFTFGYVLIYGTSALLWKSKKHRATTLSTTDAEYVAATEITRELCFVRNIFDELGIPFITPVHLHGDNINANSLANSTYLLLDLTVCCTNFFVLFSPELVFL